jgi:hypothetical protein
LVWFGAVGVWVRNATHESGKQPMHGLRIASALKKLSLQDHSEIKPFDRVV